MTNLQSRYAPYMPQDPFLAQVDPQGPSFLDTGACLCALQTTPARNSDEAAWQCIGNQTQGVYQATTGKWFKAADSGAKVDGPINDNSNAPETKTALVWTSGALKELTDDDNLSIYDDACTGENQTTFSTAFYRVEKDDEAIESLPCWRAGALPIKIQEAKDWEKAGCLEGFLCKTTTSALSCFNCSC